VQNDSLIIVVQVRHDPSYFCSQNSVFCPDWLPFEMYLLCILSTKSMPLHILFLKLFTVFL
jgi:hypothetical protein